MRFNLVCDSETMGKIKKLSEVYSERAGVPVSLSQAVCRAIGETADREGAVEKKPSVDRQVFDMIQAIYAMPDELSKGFDDAWFALGEHGPKVYNIYQSFSMLRSDLRDRTTRADAERRIALAMGLL